MKPSTSTLTALATLSALLAYVFRYAAVLQAQTPGAITALDLLSLVCILGFVSAFWRLARS